MGKPVQSVINVGKGVLGLGKTDTSAMGAFNRTPEQIEAEKKLLGQLTQGLGQFDTTASDLASRKAMSMAAGQSRQASNPFLGIKAAQQAQMEGQEMAKMNEFERQAQQQRTLADLISGQRQAAQQSAQAQMETSQADQARRTGFIGNLAGSGATLGAGYLKGKEKDSDENIKENKKAIEDSGGKIDEFLSKLDPYTFEYKNKDLGSKQMGVMAQDLEKSEVGSAAVREVNGSKVVDPSHLTMPILAAQSDMFKRIKELEDKVKKRA